MKRIIKLNLSLLVMMVAFFMRPEIMQVIRVAAADEEIVRDLAINDAISKVEVYLSEYSKEDLTDDSVAEKLEPKEYLIKKLETDGFTKEEIIKVFEVIANNRREELINLVTMYLEEEPLLSKNAMISKLKENDYSQKEIEYGIESMDIDWEKQAVKASEEYINTEIEFENESYLIISRKSLVYFLVEEKDFTSEEAISGIERSAIDWKEQAFKQAEYYLAAYTYSKKSLIEELILDGFTKEEIEYGIAQTQTNWKEQAVSKAESYSDESLIHSKSELTNYLKREGFTEEETAYAVNRIFKDVVEDEFEAEEPSTNVPERPLIIKPLESIASYLVISAQASTNKRKESEDLLPEKPNTTVVKKNKSLKKEASRVVETKVVEDVQELEESLFDSPIFMPVILVLVVGNLYLFQKM